MIDAQTWSQHGDRLNSAHILQHQSRTATHNSARKINNLTRQSLLFVHMLCEKLLTLPSVQRSGDIRNNNALLMMPPFTGNILIAVMTAPSIRAAKEQRDEAQLCNSPSLATNPCHTVVSLQAILCNLPTAAKRSQSPALCVALARVNATSP